MDTSFEKRNLDEFEDKAPKFGFGDRGEARFADGEIAKSLTFLKAPANTGSLEFDFAAKAVRDDRDRL